MKILKRLALWIKQRRCRHTEFEQISAVKVRCKQCGREFILYQIGGRSSD